MNKSEILLRLEARKIMTSTGCWLFSGPNTTNKREIYIGDKNYLVTRVSAFIFKDLNLNISTKLVCHYSWCPEPNCWNPQHYYIGDSTTNVRDAIEDGVHRNGNSGKLICKNGHHLFGHNIYEYTDLDGKKHRWCKACRNKRSIKHKRRKA